MRTKLGQVLVGVLVLIGAGCTGSGGAHQTPQSESALGARAAAALRQGDSAAAREALAVALRSQPNNGNFHLMNGLSYQMEGTSNESLHLAKVGYDAAVKFAPGNYWSHYLAGSASMEMQNYSEAAEHFSEAILDNPERPEAFLGLAAAAYFAGELGVASAASARALSLSPADPLAFRMAAHIAAARGDRTRMEEIVRKARTELAEPAEVDRYEPRLGQLVRAASTAAPTGEADGGVQTEGVRLDDPKQVMVEVTLLLNQSQTGRTTGINLMDGLTLQFGAEHLTTDTHVTGQPDTFSRVFTTALRVPQLTYSLNLFNTKTDFYRVIARPSLVAYLEQPSEFFIGRTVNVGVSGINMGSISPVDVGISVKVTPYEITPDHGKFKVEVIRSFFSQESGGTFAQSLTTFKQTVSATAAVDFGKTLILSGLYEAVETGASSKTPVLGDIPVVDTLFNARTRTERRDVALVLVTPRLAGTINTGTREFRSETLNRLLGVWNTLVDPTSGLDTVIGVLEHPHKNSTLFAPKVGDVRLPAVSGMLEKLIGETVAQVN